jgi:hypothetical protein
MERRAFYLSTFSFQTTDDLRDAFRTAEQQKNSLQQPQARTLAATQVRTKSFHFLPQPPPQAKHKQQIQGGQWLTWLQKKMRCFGKKRPQMSPPKLAASIEHAHIPPTRGHTTLRKRPSLARPLKAPSGLHRQKNHYSPKLSTEMCHGSWAITIHLEAVLSGKQL